MGYKKRNSWFSAIINIILIIVAFIIIKEVWHEYEINNFGDFSRAEYNSGVSTFSRDDTVKFSKKYSYKIY